MALGINVRPLEVITSWYSLPSCYQQHWYCIL